SARPPRRGTPPDRTLRSAPPPRRGPRGRRAPRPGSPPDVSLHRALDVRRVPEVGREVLPAAVREDAHDDALVELGGEAPGHVDDGSGGDAREDPLPIEQRADPGDRLLVRDEELPVELRQVED